MSGTVAIVAGDTGRFTDFTRSIGKLQKPPGADVNVLIGSDTIKGRNEQVDQMVGDWIWFIDDDHEFAPNTLMRLLEHQVDVVVPLCLMRSRPFNPVDYVALEDDLLYPLDLRTAKKSGTVELFAAGTSGMLIRRRVFDAYRARWPEAPFFEHGERSEDIIFCERLRELGVKIHLDLGTRLGHLNIVSIYPDFATDGSWAIGMRIGQDFPLQIGISE